MSIIERFWTLKWWVSLSTRPSFFWGLKFWHTNGGFLNHGGTPWSLDGSWKIPSINRWFGGIPMGNLQITRSPWCWSTWTSARTSRSSFRRKCSRKSPKAPAARSRTFPSTRPDWAAVNCWSATEGLRDFSGDVKCGCLKTYIYIYIYNYIQLVLYTHT